MRISGMNPDIYSEFPNRRFRKGWILTTPIKFGAVSNALAKRVKTFDECQLRNLVLEELDDLKEPERSNLHSFYVNLFSYQESVSGEYRPMEINTIFQRSMCEGPSFAKWLDEAKSFWLGKYSNRKYYSDEIYDKFAGMTYPEKYLDLSGIYRSNSLFFWKPDDPDLTKICYDPVCIQDKTLEDFRWCARKYLSDPLIDLLQEPDWSDIYRVTDRGTLGGKNFQMADLAPATVRGPSRISYVARELKGSRAAPVNEYSSTLTIRMIDKALMLILSDDKRNVMRKTPQTLKDELNKNIKGKFSYCRDFNKEGLTKPREILRVLLEELYDRTNWSCFKNVQFFDNWTYIEGGVEHHPPRGHGLGCANALTTFMSIIIENVVVMRTNIRPNWSGYNNDDAALIFNSIDDALTYGSKDRQVCNELSLAFKPKASYIARGEVCLCEQYANDKNRQYGWKGSYYKEAFFNLLKCRNVAHAQYIARMTDVSYVSKSDQQFIMDYWGYVLFRNEQSRPKELGGWFSSKFGPVNIAICNKHALETVPREEYCAIKTYSKIEVSFFKWDKRMADNRLFSHLNNEYLDKLGIQRKLPVNELLRPSMNPKEEKHSWDIYLRKLRREFSYQESAYDHAETKPTYLDLYKFWDEKNPEIDIVPPEGMRRRAFTFETAVQNKEFHSIYGTTSTEQSIRLFEMTGSVYPDVVREGKITLGVYKSRKANYRDAIERTELKFPHLSRDWETYLLPTMDIMESVCHPFEYTRASDLCASVEYEIYLPGELSDSKKAILEERRKICRDLPATFWFDINVKPEDMFVIQCCQHLEDEDLVALAKLLRTTPGFGRIALRNPQEEWPRLFLEYRRAKKESHRFETTEQISTAEEIIEVPTGFEELIPENESYSSLEEVEYIDQLELENKCENQFDFSMIFAEENSDECVEEEEHTPLPPSEPPPILEEFSEPSCDESQEGDFASDNSETKESYLDIDLNDERFQNLTNEQIEEMLANEYFDDDEDFW